LSSRGNEARAKRDKALCTRASTRSAVFSAQSEKKKKKTIDGIDRFLYNSSCVQTSRASTDSREKVGRARSRAHGTGTALVRTPGEKIFDEPRIAARGKAYFEMRRESHEILVRSCAFGGDPFARER
jgi:hypothetical protein